MRTIHFYCALLMTSLLLVVSGCEESSFQSGVSTSTTTNEVDNDNDNLEEIVEAPEEESETENTPEFPQSTPYNVDDGCLAINSCNLTNNRNQFDVRLINRSEFERNGGCEFNNRCPSSMNFVCDERLATRVCVARDMVLIRAESGAMIPRGNMNYQACVSSCERAGGRVLTNNEWLVAMNGTHARHCRAPAPRDRRRGSPTQDAPDFNSPEDMRNLRFNEKGFRQDRSLCVSIYGIRDGASVLGQWVSNGFRRNRPQFNGGLWAFPSASTVFYRTTAHGPSYSDYSIGCRCGADPQ